MKQSENGKNYLSDYAQRKFFFIASDTSYYFALFHPFFQISYQGKVGLLGTFAFLLLMIPYRVVLVVVFA